MAYPPAGRVLGLGIRQLLTPPTYLLIWDTSSGSGFSSGNMSALLLVHGVITVRISRRWTCQLRWAKLRITASVMHERNASSGSVLGINWVALLVRHFTEIPPVCGVCNVTSRDLVGRHHLPTRGSSTFLGSYRIAVGIHLAGCSWFQIAENTIAKIHFTGCGYGAQAVCRTGVCTSTTLARDAFCIRHSHRGPMLPTVTRFRRWIGGIFIISAWDSVMFKP